MRARDLFDRPPPNVVTVEKYTQLRKEFGIFAEFVEAYIPESPEATITIRKLWEAYTYANLAVGLHTVPPVDKSSD